MASFFRWLVLPLSLLCNTLGAADWPQWRGPTQDGRVPPGVAIPSHLPSVPTVVWERPVGDSLGSPVVSGGRLFHLDHRDGHEVVHALDAASGQELWSRPFDAVFRDTQSAPGPRSTPLADGDRVYVQSCQGQFECLNVRDGQPIWRVHFVRDFNAVFFGERGSATGASRHGNTASPVLIGDDLLVAVGGTNGASVVRFDKRTGRVVWKSQSDVPGHSGPVLGKLADTTQAVSFTAAGVMALDPATGARLWQVPVKSSIGRHIATPLLFDDLVVVSSHEAGLLGIRVDRHEGSWRAQTAWQTRESAVNFSSPVAITNHLYGVGPNRNLICVDVQTGRQTWSQDGLLVGAPGSAHAAFVVMEDRILALTDGGEIVLFAADPEAYRELGRAQVCGRTWCNPAYVDGRLYLRDAKVLRCIQVRP
jgi:outer membrane protein assembly factor BamB